MILRNINVSNFKILTIFDKGTHMLIRKFLQKTISPLLTVSLLLTGCNIGATPAPTLDVNAINTAVVGTTVAQLAGQMTQTALVAPTSTPLPAAALPTFALPTENANALPTISFNSTPLSNPTPLAGFTQLATSVPANSLSTASGCNDASFVGETLKDGSVIKAGEKFTKAWELKNTGTCTWDQGYVFTFLADVSNSAIKGYDIAINNSDEYTKPGNSQSFIVKIVAPDAAGEYKGYWKMRADDNTFFGPRVYFDIVVK